jgi:nucleotide-binding universal stress UspA family protein
VELLERVVVGIDGTEWGDEALRQTLVLAPADGSAVHAVTALDTRPAAWTGFEIAHWQKLLEQEAEEARAGAETILANRHGSSAQVERGKPVDVLRRARDEADATALALGGRRSSRLLGIVMGDTATELLHDAKCSVLLARPPREDGTVWRPETVVVGVDGSTSALSALEAADEIATRVGGAVEVVAAGGLRPDESEPEWAERVSSWDQEHPATALLARSEHADLVVVGSRGLRGLKALGSVSERVAHQAKCSVLVVHTPF